MKIRLSPPTFFKGNVFLIQSKNKILLLYSFPRAAEVNSHKLGALQQQKCIPSQFWRPAQGEHCLERVHPCVSLASGGCLHSSASPSCSCTAPWSLLPSPGGHLSSVHVTLFLNLSLLIRTLIIRFRANPNLVWLHLNSSMSKDLISKGGHIHRYQVLGIQHIF